MLYFLGSFQSILDQSLLYIRNNVVATTCRTPSPPIPEPELIILAKPDLLFVLTTMLISDREDCSHFGFEALQQSDRRADMVLSSGLDMLQALLWPDQDHKSAESSQKESAPPPTG